MAHQTFEDLIASMTPEVWHNMRTAIETGRWPDGRKLTGEQRELCLQAVIAWEQRNLPEEERVGFMEQACKSAEPESQEPAEQPVTLRKSQTP